MSGISSFRPLRYSLFLSALLVTSSLGIAIKKEQEGYTDIHANSDIGRLRGVGHGFARMNECVAGQLPGITGSEPWRLASNIRTTLLPTYKYPLNLDLLASAVKGGDVHRLTGVLDKLRRGDSVRLASLGGSFTAGMFCSDGEFNRTQCAWPARTARWFQSTFPRADIVWHHWERLSTTSSGLIQWIERDLLDTPQRPDIIFVDTLVNDADGGSSQEYTFAYEALLRSLQSSMPNSQLIVVEAGSRYAFQPSREHVAIARHYSIPVLDYMSLVAVDCKDYRHNMGTLWPCHLGESAQDFVPMFGTPETILTTGKKSINHPPWLVHEHVSNLVAYGVLSLLNDACAGKSDSVAQQPAATYWPQSEVEKFPYCEHTLSRYESMPLSSREGPGGWQDVWHTKPGGWKQGPQYVYGASTLQPRVIAGDWSFFADVPGKPGWIATSPGSRITFPVRMKQGKLMIEFLKSYEHIGSANATLYSVGRGTSGKPMLLDGVWSSTSSQSVFYIANVGENIQPVCGSSSSQGDELCEAELEISLPDVIPATSHDSKFKVLSVLSC